MTPQEEAIAFMRERDNIPADVTDEQIGKLMLTQWAAVHIAIGRLSKTVCDEILRRLP